MKQPEKLPIPDWIDDDAKKEFRRIADILGDKITLLDWSVLADYASTFVECQNLEVLIKVEGMKLVGPKGGEYLNPTVNLLLNRKDALARLRRDLGLTPSARKDRTPGGGKKLGDLLEGNA